MLYLDDGIIDHITNPIIITDSQGKILKKNKAATFLIKQFFPDAEIMRTIFQIDSNFHSGTGSLCSPQFMKIGETTKAVNVFFIKNEQNNPHFLHIFGSSSILKTVNCSSLLNYIDDAIIIVNKEHIVEEINEAFFRLTGVETKYGRGWKIENSIRDGVLKKAVSLRVFKLKTHQTAKIQYKTGKTIFWSMSPVFDKNGEVEWVIGTGRDISELVRLEAKLDKIETLKARYYEKLRKLETSRHKTNIIFVSNEMKMVIDVLLQAASSDAPVFIWGESGVGKELIANLVHESSSRRKKPFIAINCAAIPHDLLESELFGYTEGAFTGAQKGGKKGLFQEAEGGTIFLDEIGEMPFSMQSKLLRVLQTNELMNIGGNKKISVDVRILSSTNLSKDKLLNNSHLRQDLYYRLAAIPIYVPALRERKEDVPVLVDHFLKIFNLRYKKNRKLSGRLLRQLYKYEWPGNVRELKNVIERLVILDKSHEIFEVDHAGENDFNTGNNDIIVQNIMPMKTALHTVKGLLIKKALDKYGSVLQAAKILGVNPVTIHREKRKMAYTNSKNSM